MLASNVADIAASIAFCIVLVIISVAGCGNLFLRNQRCVTDGALNAIGQAGGRAGSIRAGNKYRIVPKCLDFLGVGITACCASVSLDTCFGASGFGGHLAIVVGVTKSIGLVCIVKVSASRASIGSKSALLAGGCGHD